MFFAVDIKTNPPLANASFLGKKPQTSGWDTKPRHSLSRMSRSSLNQALLESASSRIISARPRFLFAVCCNKKHGVQSPVNLYYKAINQRSSSN